MYFSEIQKNRRMMMWARILGRFLYISLLAVSCLFVGFFLQMFTQFLMLFMFPHYRIGIPNFQLQQFNDSLLVVLWAVASVISFIWILRFNLGSQKYQYKNFANRIVDRYDAKLLRNHTAYLSLFNLVDEICVGLDLETPTIYLITAKRYSKISNVMAFNNEDGYPYLFITQHLLDTLPKYELEAVIASALLSDASDYNNLLLVHYIYFSSVYALMSFYGVAFIVLIRLMATVAIAIWPVSIAVLIITYLYLQFSQRYRDSVNKHLQFLNTQVIHLTNNPQALINAYTQLSQEKANFKDVNKLDALLWLKPIQEVQKDGGRLSLSQQVAKLKLF